MQRICLLVVLAMASSVFAHAQANVSSITVNASGAALLTTDGLSSNTVTGYARLSGDGKTPLPAGQAILSFSKNGVLINETAVAGTTPILAGRFYAEVVDSVSTGLAIANPNDLAATISFFFTDSDGTDFGQGSMTLAANNQIARFLDQPPFSASAPLRGTFTFRSSIPVAAVVLRGSTNERSEFLMTTLPVADLNGAPQNQPILFPHYADGGGWTTQVILVNPTDFPMYGSMQFFGQISATASDDTINVPSGAGTFNYFIPPRGSRRFQSAGAGDFPHSGSFQVMPTNYSGVPDSVSTTPSGVAIFSYKQAYITITEAAVPPVNASTAFRIYGESSGDFKTHKSGAVQSGVAIANASTFPVTVDFELLKPNGVSVGLTGSLDLVPNGQTALFLTEIPGFASLKLPFKGVLRVSVPPGPGISVVGLRGRYNERGDLLIATTPPVTDNSTQPTQSIFPDVAIGGGYSTQVILLNTDPQNRRTAVLKFLTPTGAALPMRILNDN